MQLNNYINNWLAIIENMNNSNTYKLAWGRAIIEICMEQSDTITYNNLEIKFDQISEKMLKYYWNQSFFFNLNQGPKNSKPVVVSLTEQLINEYKIGILSNNPVWFEKVIFNDRLFTSYQTTIGKINTAIKQDVCWRFPKVNRIPLHIYDLDRKNKVVNIKSEYVNQLKEFGGILIKLLNYKWTQLLELYNTSPRIASKVKGSGKAKIRRNSLIKFKELLLLQYETDELYDFYTGNKLVLSDLSVDHVIPWSFLYSDDIWNLVLTTRSNNSIKSNRIPTKYEIEKLKVRNIELLDVLKDKNKYYNIVSKSTINELELSIQNNFVDKFYAACRG